MFVKKIKKNKKKIPTFHGSLVCGGPGKSIFGMSDLDAKNFHLAGDFAFELRILLKFPICLLFYLDFFSVVDILVYIFFLPPPRKRKTLCVEGWVGGVFTLSKKLFFVSFFCTA